MTGQELDGIREELWNKGWLTLPWVVAEQWSMRIEKNGGSFGQAWQEWEKRRVKDYGLIYDVV
jgi:hypothetical protein